MPTQETLELIGAIAGAVTLLGGSIVAGRKLVKFLRRIGHFLDDWFGAPAREGVEERLGVMARLAAEESATGELRETQQTATAGLQQAVTDLTEQIEQQPQHIDQLCVEMKDQLREERQEVIRAAITQHQSAFHAQPGAQQ